MKRILWTSMIVWVIGGCRSGNNADFDLSDYPPGTRVEVYSNMPDLVRVSYTDPYDTDKILAEGDYKDGKKHGVWIEYDTDHLIPTLIQTYYEGKLQGVEILLENGSIKQKTYFVNGDRHGQMQTYQNRRVQEIRNYKKGVLEGLVTKYYPNGRLMEEAPYKNGKIDGLAKWYDQQGNLKFQYLYEDGQLVDQDPIPVDGEDTPDEDSVETAESEN